MRTCTNQHVALLQSSLANVTGCIDQISGSYISVAEFVMAFSRHSAHHPDVANNAGNLRWTNACPIENAQPRGERLGVGALARDAGREAGISGIVFG